MSTTTKIEWTRSDDGAAGATWNPVTGCTKVSEGCDNCYAETFAERWHGVPGHPFEQGFDVRLWPERVRLPLRWRKPRRVFLNSMAGGSCDLVTLWCNLVMERVEVELFTDGSNNAVVRMPGRSFPGVLIQGDSLSIIRADIANLRDACRTEGATEALELAELLLEDLDVIMLRYTDALERHDLRKPF